MTKRTRVVLLIVAAVILIYPALAWLTGLGTERTLARNEQLLLEQNKYLVLRDRQYHRGIYSSTEVLTYGVGGPFLGINSPIAQALTNLQLTVRNTIHHGPLPGLRAFGLASIDSQLQLTSRAGTVTANAITPNTAAPGTATAGTTTPGTAIPGTAAQGTTAQDQPAVQIHTLIGWLGGGRSIIHSPALHYRNATGTQFDWRGLDGSIHYGRNLNAWAATITAPGFDAQSDQGHLTLTGIAFTADNRRAFDAFYLGDSRFELARAEYRPASGDPLVFQGITIHGISNPSTADAQYIDSTANLTVDEIQTTPFSATHVGYDVSFNHLYGPSLAAMTQDMRSVQRDPASPTERTRQLLEVLNRYGPPLMLHDPVIRIDRIGFVTPQGELRLSGRITFSGLASADLQGTAAMAALVQHARAAFDLRVDTALADKLLGSSNRGAAIAAQMQQFENLGYLKREGGLYTAHVDYQAGKLLINGLPWPPAGPATTN